MQENLQDDQVCVETLKKENTELAAFSFCDERTCSASSLIVVRLLPSMRAGRSP
jgi:hypothetical protein